MIRKLLRICSIVLFLSFAYKRLESSKIQYNEIYKVIQQFQNENNNTSSKIDVLEKLFKKFKMKMKNQIMRIQIIHVGVQIGMVILHGKDR